MKSLRRGCMKKDEESPRQNPEEYQYLSLGNGGKASKRKLEGVANNRGGKYPEDDIVTEVKKGDCFHTRGKMENVLCIWQHRGH